MKSGIKYALGGLSLAAVLGLIYVLNFGFYSRFFDIAWDEEVQLHDGRVILVHVKQTYERRGVRLAPYANTTFRRNEFTFDSGSTPGRITFGSRLGISYIDQINGSWYAVLFGQGPYGNHADEMPDHWGQDFTMQEERLASLKNGQFSPIAWELAPTGAILHNNLKVGSMSAEVLASFQNKRMTLNDKTNLRVAYPPGPGGGQISRPIRMQKIKGEAK